MIFHGNRGPEKRHHPISLHLINDTTELFDDAAHFCDGFVNDKLALLGVAVIEKGVGTGDVAKQHRHYFSFVRSTCIHLDSIKGEQIT